MDLRKICDSVDEQGWVKVAIKVANNKVDEAKTVLDQLGYTAYDIEGSGNDKVIKVSTQHPDETKAKLLPKLKEAGITPISTRVTDSNKRLDEYILGSLRANGIESAVNVEQHKDGFRVSLQGNTDVYLDIYLDGENVVVRGFDPDGIVNVTRYATFAGIPAEQAKQVIRKFEKWANKVAKLDARPVAELESVRVTDGLNIPAYSKKYIEDALWSALGLRVKVTTEDGRITIAIPNTPVKDSVEDLKLPKFSSSAKLNKLCTSLADSILAHFVDESTETMLSELQRYKSEFPKVPGYNFIQDGNTGIISYSDAQDELQNAGYTTKMSDTAAWDAVCRTMGQVIRTLLEHKEELLKQKVTDSLVANNPFKQYEAEIREKMNDTSRVYDSAKIKSASLRAALKKAGKLQDSVESESAVQSAIASAKLKVSAKMRAALMRLAKRKTPIERVEFKQERIASNIHDKDAYDYADVFYYHTPANKHATVSWDGEVHNAMN